jgi:hypothetical protein
MKNGRAVGKVSRNVDRTLDIRRQMVTAEKLRSKKNRGGFLGARVHKVCMIVGHRDFPGRCPSSCTAEKHRDASGKLISPNRCVHFHPHTERCVLVYQSC